MKTLYIFIGLFLLFLAGMYWYSVSSPLRVTSEEAKNLIKKGYFVLDVRTDAERALLGHYPNDIHVESTQLKDKIDLFLPDKNAGVVLYCNSGQRARMAAETMHKLGYKNAVYISSSYTSIL